MKNLTEEERVELYYEAMSYVAGYDWKKYMSDIKIALNKLKQKYEKLKHIG